MQVFKFGNIYLNTQSRQVVKNGKPVIFTPKTFDVLQFLVENSGKIVTKDELLNNVWNGHVVEESNLAVHISKLRNLLSANKAEPLIETIQGSGYRFVAMVQPVDLQEWEHNSTSNNNHSNNVNSTGNFSDSIAVLPLKNEINDEDIDYLVDGLTESIINSLAYIPNLKVIARNSVFRYKNKDVNFREIAATLGVSKILTGRTKVIKNNLIISVELINAVDDSQLWGFQYNHRFSDVIKIQEEIISKVSSKLQAEISKLLNTQVHNPITANKESFRLYLKGKYFFDILMKDSIYKAIECFEQSITFDPLNVYSYVEIIDSYRILYVYDYISYEEALEKIDPYLSVISKLNQSVAEVQAVLGAVKETLQWKFAEAEDHYKKAIALNPDYLTAHYRYSNLLTDLGKFSEAMEEINKIIAIDPVSISSYRRIGRLFYKMGQHKNAIKYLKESLELEPADYISLGLLSGVLTDMGNYEEALTLIEKSLKIQFNLDILTHKAYIHILLGNKAEYRKIIAQLEDKLKNKRHISIKLARLYLALGDKKKTYDLLEKSYLEHDYDLTSIKCDPRMKSIRNEERFKKLVSKIGLPND